MALLKDLQIGTRVKIHSDSFEKKPKGRVAIINDPEENPGKHIGVELDEHVPFAHGLDAKLKNGKPQRYSEDKIDEDGVKYAEKDDVVTNVRKGRGWWTVPEELEIIGND